MLDRICVWPYLDRETHTTIDFIWNFAFIYLIILNGQKVSFFKAISLLIERRADKR